MAACSVQRSVANRAHHDLASSWYTVDSYKAAYKPEFHPVRDRRFWGAYNGPQILPPTVRRPLGRPRSTRMKGVMDEGQSSKSIRCTKCGVLGHNRKRCVTAV